MIMTAARERSLVSLSLLCFALADVRDGLGPFLGVYLQRCGWTPDAIGYAMTLGGLVAVGSAPLLGALTDATRHKRLCMAVVVLGLVLAAGSVFLHPVPWLVGMSQLGQGVMGAAVAPLLSGLTLGMVGQAGLPARLGRNEAWNHAGNATSAVLGGLVGWFCGLAGVFLVMAGMGVLALLAVRGMDPACIDHNVARGLEAEPQGHAAHEVRTEGRLASSFRLLLGNRALFCVGLILLFFHLGNAAMLPLLGQSAVARFDVNPAVYTACTVVLAQLVMVGAALWTARLAARRGYGPALFCALLVLPVRGCIAGFWHSPWSIVPVQLLDGMGAGVLGVVTPGVVAVLLRGSGHVNLGLGMVMTMQGIGAAFSTTWGGLFAQYAGYSAAFLALAAAPCVALLCLLRGLRRLPALRRALARQGGGNPSGEAAARPLDSARPD